MPDHNFQNDCRNPNWQPTCSTCPYFKKQINTTGGFCSAHGGVYVTIHGGCDLHPETPQDAAT